jgi:hypothetical protein
MHHFSKIKRGLFVIGAFGFLLGCVQNTTANTTNNNAQKTRAPSCSDRIGRCFEAQIGGYWATAIADVGEFETLRQLLQATGERVGDVYWSVDEPLTKTSALDVFVRTNDMGRDFLGALRIEEPDVTIFSLDDQWLDVIPEMVPSRTVFVNDSPMMLLQDILAQDYLPPGRYALAIEFHGKKNWDRKWVFIKVR